MKTLGVTSPYTTGREVEQAQRRLKRSNIFTADYLRGPIDGTFGEATGRACVRAKYWLGYPADDYVKPIYGDLLNNYLGGDRPLPDEYLRRRAARLEQLRNRPLGEKALSLARSYLGVMENPAGSNRVVFTDWYGMVGPWCAMFATYCYVQAGSASFLRGSRWAYVPYIVNDAKAGRYDLQTVRVPLPGDLVCYDWDGRGVADHVGLFEKWDNAARTEFAAIEGNTSTSSDSNGGAVMRRHRRTDQVQAYVRAGR